MWVHRYGFKDIVLLPGKFHTEERKDPSDQWKKFTVLGNSVAFPWGTYYKWVIIITMRKRKMKAVGAQEVSIRPNVTEERGEAPPKSLRWG